MLKGFNSGDISYETLEKEKENIEQQALERFLEEKSEEKNKQLPKEGMLFNSRDSIAMERILGKNDLFPISYLQIGLNISKSVCRISIRDSRGVVVGYGTGFLVSPNIILTNNHVINSYEVASNSIAEFNYQDDENFMPCPTYNFKLNPQTFFITDVKLDFTLVALNENITNQKHLTDFSYLKMSQKEGTILPEEYVSIIQHPKGGPKSVTLRENKVSGLKENFIHYLTDTEPGSSGSPVFNDQWTLVALHHSGVPNPEIKDEWIANEGILISAIVNYLAKKYSSLKEDEQAIIKEIVPDIELPKENNTTPNGDDDEPLGYNPLFLGKDYEVPLPRLSKEMEKDTAKTEDGSYILDYMHFSIVMKKSRGLAYFTAVNIDGTDEVKIKRSADNWKFDPRISRDYQYGDEVYTGNELDRGHLVRRTDPNWGKNAIKANEDTFYFTNSTPQHKNLNQKTWVELENYIFRNAVLNQFKISVFTGPVFREDDMIYRQKYQIPAEFWKVVVMLKEDGNISATAYLQTQKNMIENLEFAYGEYKTYQVPVRNIEKLTGLDFGNLSNFDPMANIEATGIVITGPESIKF
ncbi:DNA/RNA non-specific endonuclease [Fusobacterium nucleatum]|uniref:Serine protease n=1 Tax=Fusobacterium nucleatum subsp. polymorphum TaxID=76857 RepID=A0A2C6B0R0_FUSNP|nr:DNA/RNA non-specific endonuclease [Fusobacterium polymorphum]PHH97780.1 endonuclease [Fusobacterium polymorphum]